MNRRSWILSFISAAVAFFCRRHSPRFRVKLNPYTEYVSVHGPKTRGLDGRTTAKLADGDNAAALGNDAIGADMRPPIGPLLLLVACLAMSFACAIAVVVMEEQNLRRKIHNIVREELSNAVAK